MQVAWGFFFLVDNNNNKIFLFALFWEFSLNFLHLKMCSNLKPSKRLFFLIFCPAWVYLFHISIEWMRKSWFFFKFLELLSTLAEFESSNTCETEKSFFFWLIIIIICHYIQHSNESLKFTCSKFSRYS